MKRVPALLLLPALFVVACASGSRSDRDLVEAGRQLRREQAPPTAVELRLEVDSFLDNELPHLQRKVDRLLERERRLWRYTFIAGSALGVLAATSGSVSSSSGGTKPALTITGALAALGGGVAYALRTPELRACRADLDTAREDVVSWRRNGIPLGDGPVAPAVWRAWVDRVAAVRSLESCRSVR